MLGKFVIIEGPNGAGKTSLIKNLQNDGFKTLSSPNGTPLAQMLRSACRGTHPYEDIDKQVQFMLFSAARYDEYLRLVHNSSEDIFADRWWTSTYVYQCCLQGIPVDFMEYTRHKDEKIDLVVILDADNQTLLNRSTKERVDNPSHGKCRWTKDEETQIKLFDLYRKELPAYLNSKGIRHIIVDTTAKSEDEVKRTVLELSNIVRIPKNEQKAG